MKVTDCGLMRMKHQRKCPRCEGTKSTTTAPEQSPVLKPSGLTRFTKYAHAGATFFA